MFFGYCLRVFGREHGAYLVKIKRSRRIGFQPIKCRRNFCMKP